MSQRQGTGLVWEARPGPFEHALDGRVQRLGGRGGLLRVLEGTVWVTVEGLEDDRVLAAGDRLHVPAGRRAWVEPWEPGQAVRIDWRPQRAGEAIGERIADARRSAFARWRSWFAAPRIAGHDLAAERTRGLACQAGRGAPGAA